VNTNITKGGAKMNLVTRSDFDGLVCGALLKEIGIIDKWKFAHPKDLQDGIIDVGSEDVLANVPYVKGCGMWFDHHSSEFERLAGDEDFVGESRIADSAARVIYDYYGKEKLGHMEEMVKAVDKVDSGKLTRDEILNPTGWILLGFIMDPRTGLGRFREFTISNYQLMEKLIDMCRTKSIEEILQDHDVDQRVALYAEHSGHFVAMLRRLSSAEKNVVLTDLRGVDTIYSGNRFLIYSLYPTQNVSIWVTDGKDKQNCAIACGYNILNKSCKSDIGAIMLKHGGGGHKQVGTCQVPYAEADKIIMQIMAELKE
jgi:nanoRNase/pAp phosphatase (c-di-AMP/oligoRNAs hydrolase)